MRLSRITLFLAICILIWGTITYFLFLNRPPNTRDDMKMQLDRKIFDFEKNVKEQYKKNREIVDNLNDLIKVKKEDFKTSHTISEPVKSEFKGTVIPVLVFACNRPSVGRCLDKLIEYRPNSDQFPIIVSQVSLHN